jgi:hypothetical protein
VDNTYDLMARNRWLAVGGLYASLSVFVGGQVVWYFGLMPHRSMSVAVALGFAFAVLFIVLERRWRYAEDVDRPGFEVLPHEEGFHPDRGADRDRHHRDRSRVGDDRA